MEIPTFPESNHHLIKSLNDSSDGFLLSRYQEYPQEGKYFTTIFCRYSPIVYSLIENSMSSLQEANYLFALTWREIFYEMRGLSLKEDTEPEINSFQKWIIYISALCINEKNLDLSKSINYNLKTGSPPLWCYLEQALEKLPPINRFVLVMKENWNWSLNRLTAYLQADGEMITQADVDIWLNQAYEMLETALPEDIRIIYLEGK